MLARKLDNELTKIRSVFKVAKQRIKNDKISAVNLVSKAITESKELSCDFAGLLQIITPQERKQIMETAVKTARSDRYFGADKGKKAINYAFMTYLSASEPERPELLEPLYQLRKSKNKSLAV